VPVLAATMMWARGFAAVERGRIGPVLGRSIPGPAYRTGTGVRRLLAPLTDPQSWRDLAHAILRFIPSTIAFSFVAVWWAGLLGGLSWAAWGWSLPGGADDQGLPELLGLGDSYGTSVGFYLVSALVFAVTLPAVTRGAARLEARFAQAFLAGRSSF
jgi:hypothetical protein